MIQLDQIKGQIPALQGLLKEAGESLWPGWVKGKADLHRRGNEQAGLLG